MDLFYSSNELGLSDWLTVIFFNLLGFNNFATSNGPHNGEFIYKCEPGKSSSVLHTHNQGRVHSSALITSLEDVCDAVSIFKVFNEEQ